MENKKTKYPKKIFKLRKRFISIFAPKTKSESEANINIDTAWNKIMRLKDSDVCWADYYLHYCFAFKRVTHYFLDENISNFCKNAFKPFEIPDDFPYPEISDPIPLDKKLKCFFMGKKGESDSVHIFNGVGPGVAVIHFPIKEQRRSIMFSCDLFAPLPLPKKRLVTRRAFIASDGEDVVTAGSNAWKKDLGDGQFISNFLFSFLLYISAFPECVIKAKRNQIKAQETYNGSREFSVTSNEVVGEELRCSISPHWRRGHFRVLNSGRFVKKKGQTIFVKGSFVKGKALDVIQNSEASQRT